MNQQLTQRWLKTLHTLIPDTYSVTLMVPDNELGSMRMLDSWPSNVQQTKDTDLIASHAAKKKEPLYLAKMLQKDKQIYDCFVFPYFVDSTLLGVVIVIALNKPDTQQEVIFSTIRQSVEWLCIANLKENKQAQPEFYSKVVELLTTCFDQRSYQQGLINLVTQLTQQFDCERVAFAEYNANQCEVIALSHSAGFDKRSNMLQKLTEAMQEAISRDNIVVFPDTQNKQIQRAHEVLSRKFDRVAICSIPLIYQQKVIGAVTLLRSETQPFSRREIDLCQQFLSLATAFLVLKREEESSLLRKVASSFKKQLSHIFGFKFLRMKLISSVILLLICTSFLIKGDFRVSADAHIEGKIQRVIAAPTSGYLFSAAVRAGDTVKEGELLASLDDSELKLQLAKHNGELQKARREHREAISKRDLVKARIVNEQLNQIKAEMALTQQQLDTIYMLAPFDAVIIEGDLSQMLGSPVERGETLFKVAPLGGYRIILTINERQISYIKPGQIGTLMLSSLYNQKFPLTIDSVTAVAKGEDGANAFRVEATLHQVPDLLRPGMEGVGKINIGQERLIWIWTHEIIDRLRLWVWSWWP